MSGALSIALLMRSITDLTPSMDAGPVMNQEVSDKLMRVFPDRAGELIAKLGGAKITQLHDNTLSQPDWRFQAALDAAFKGLPSAHSCSDPTSSHSYL